jgi:ABC-type branched-subunit amino acid transport system permease subunit
MALIDQIILFVVGLLVGGLAIYLGARVVLKSNDYSYAVFTALIGAVVLAVLQYILSITGGLGGLSFIVTLLVWVAVIRWRYSASWINSAVTGLVAWVALVLVLFVLSAAGLTPPEAVGFPAGLL